MGRTVGGWLVLGLILALGMAFSQQASNGITREQFLQVQYNSLRAQGLISASESTESLNAFADLDQITPGAEPALTWAVENNIISGSPSPRGLLLNPQGVLSVAALQVLTDRILALRLPAPQAAEAPEEGLQAVLTVSPTIFQTELAETRAAIAQATQRAQEAEGRATEAARVALEARLDRAAAEAARDQARAALAASEMRVAELFAQQRSEMRARLEAETRAELAEILISSLRQELDRARTEVDAARQAAASAEEQAVAAERKSRQEGTARLAAEAVMARATAASETAEQEIVRCFELQRQAETARLEAEDKRAQAEARVDQLTAELVRAQQARDEALNQLVIVEQTLDKVLGASEVTAQELVAFFQQAQAAQQAQRAAEIQAQEAQAVVTALRQEAGIPPEPPSEQVASASTPEVSPGPEVAATPGAGGATPPPEGQ